MRECSTFPLHHVRPGKEAIDTECGTICHIVTAPSSSLSLFLCLSHTSSTDRIMWAASSYYPFYLSLSLSFSLPHVSLSVEMSRHLKSAWRFSPSPRTVILSFPPILSFLLLYSNFLLSSPFLISSPFLRSSLFPPSSFSPSLFILPLREVFSSILLDYLTGISGRRTMVSLLLAGGSISQHMVAQRGGMQ